MQNTVVSQYQVTQQTFLQKNILHCFTFSLWEKKVSSQSLNLISHPREEDVCSISNTIVPKSACFVERNPVGNHLNLKSIRSH